MEKDRKCFRMIGGVLVERTVGEVLPALEQNRDQLVKVISTLVSQLESKGKEINDYREKHNIRLNQKIKIFKKIGSKKVKIFVFLKVPR